jgi:hypothetical protein
VDIGRAVLRSPRLLLALLPLGLCGCGSSSGSNEGAGGTSNLGGLGQGGVAASALPYAPCSAESAVGQFVIELAPEFTRVGGKVSDATLPSQIPEELARDGECGLYRAVVSSCQPACRVAFESCGPDAQCVPLPRAVDLGTITVLGMLVPLEMRANSVTNSYANPARPVLPNPGFLPGADLRIVTGGGDYAPFELRGWGVSALELGPGQSRVDAGRATALTWRAPSAPGPARLHVELNINQHGSTSAWIACDFPDTGAAEIPAALIDGLMGLGRSGFPTLTATRRTATSADIESGCVDLLVTSEVAASVEVEGIISCNTSSMCPSGLTCLPVERFCE